MECPSTEKVICYITRISCFNCCIFDMAHAYLILKLFYVVYIYGFWYAFLKLEELLPFLFWFPDVLEGEIFLQNLPSIVTAHVLGRSCLYLKR